MTPPVNPASPEHTVSSNVERLLALGGDFTRHHDTLQALTLLRDPNPAAALSQHIPTTHTLAEEAQEVSEALHQIEQHYRSPDLRAGIERPVQLAALATLAADHLQDTADLLQDAKPPGGRGPALLQAGRRAVLAGKLTSLGAEDCLATASLLAREMRRRRIAPVQQPPSLSLAQHRVLEADAASRVTVGQQGELQVLRGKVRVTIATVHALEVRGLL